MAHLYLREDLVSAEPGDEVALEGPEARHAVAVSRARSGERIAVSNGRGLMLEGVIAAATPSRLVLRVDSASIAQRPAPRIVLVQALAKGGRDELAVQAAVELGADEVVPWQASRCVSRWAGEKAAKGVQRWSAIVHEAAKQSMRAWLPTVGDPVTTAQLAARAPDARMIVLEPLADAPLTGIRIEPTDPREVVVVVGPEGGIAPEESRRLREAGARPARLGDAVLRTSSAGPAAIAVLNAALGRW